MHWSEGCGHAFEALNSVKVFVADTKTTLALNLVLLGVTTITKHQNGVIITTKIKTVRHWSLHIHLYPPVMLALCYAVLLQLLRTGGPELLDDLSLAKQCKIGENISTSGHALPAKCKSYLGR
jgi:hypothetical protein